MKRLIPLLFLLLSPVLAADTDRDGPLFMKDLLGERDFPPAWGVGFDFFTLDQDYALRELEFQLPGIPAVDPAAIRVNNRLAHYDLKLDLWLTPFLNLYGILGYIDADTRVDLSQLGLELGGFPLHQFDLDYSGRVYGAGAVLAYGGENWFTLLNLTWTDTRLDGDFKSSVSSFTAQPKIGLIRDSWTAWLGGMYLDTREKHSGVFTIPLPGQVIQIPFAVELESADKWNYALGASYNFSRRSRISLEIGFGSRLHTLFNYNWRF